MNARSNQRKPRKQNNNQNNNQGGSKSRGRNRSKNKSRRLDPVVFWGDPDALPDPDGFETESPEPLSIVHSLGRAPVPGVLAEPYFAAVYDRAAGLATVLSDAAGLDELTPLESDDEDVADDTAGSANDRHDEEE